MPTQLVVISGPDKGRVFPLAADGVCSVGRGGQTVTRLVDVAVSRAHCEVRMDHGRVVVTDGKSASGTLVNGKRITTHELHAGDVIRIGDTELRFEQEVAEQATMPPPVPVATAAPPVEAAVFANKPGARAVPKALRDLQSLKGQALGSYQLLDVLGTGQIGVVFKARDANKFLALKVLRPDLAKDKKAMQRFVRGMMSVRTLTHPNLIELYNAGITGEHAWIAMELIHGSSVAQLQASAAKDRDWRMALGVAVDVSRALGMIHEHGMIHRNVMPQNIMVRESDKVAKLGDAMLAKALEGNTSQEVTASGEFVGNVYYMAPERTMRDAEVDGRADLFSLGTTLYALLTGRLPFEGTSMVEVITKIRQQAPKKPSEANPAIPAAFDAIVVKMLAKKPEDRYPSAKALLADLEPLVQRPNVAK